MKKSILLSILLLSILSFTGCSTMNGGNASLSNVSQQNLSNKIIQGKTTEAQIQQMLGKPNSASLNDKGDVTWVYMYQKGNVNAATYLPIIDIFASSATIHQKTLTITFNKNNIVKNWTYNQQNYTGN